MTGQATSFKDRLNAYQCAVCEQIIVTRDEDEGTTPFMMTCRASQDCHGMMQSHFYPGMPPFAPHYIWRKPTHAEYKTADEATRDHYDKGGLMLTRAPEVIL